MRQEYRHGRAAVEMTAERRRVAVVGGGVAGLTAAHVLRRRDEVTLYEADDRLGGHAHTHELPGDAGRTVGVDSGFIVHNERTYPRLRRLFAELGVATQESEMSLSVRCEGCGLEYAGARGPRGLFARPRQAVSPAYLRLLAEVPRFHRRARALLADPAAAEAPGARGEPATLGAFLREHRFSRYFTGHFVVPLVSSVWSCAPGTALRYPARYLFRFLAQHGMLTVTGSPTWRTVTGGSAEYVRRIAKQLDAVRTGAPVRSLRRTGAGVEVATADGRRARYDAAVVAVHPDQALRLLAAPTEAERAVLGAFRYSRNETVLHTDTSLLPRAANARASWNHLLPSCAATADRVLVTYDLSRLQRLAAPERYLVTLGAADRVAPGRVLRRMVYRHPVYTPPTLAAQRRLPELNGPVLAYAGAYHGWGFHEDGCRSGVAAAAALGVAW